MVAPVVRRFYLSFVLVFIGIVASMALGGVAMHFWGGVAGLIVLVAGIVGCTVWAIGSISKPTKEDQRLAVSGIEANAVILQVIDSRITINDLDYVVKLILRVEPSNGTPFQAETEITVSRVGLPPVGGRLRVKYDPANPKHVVMTSDAITVGGGEVSQAAPQTDSEQVVDFMKQHGLDQAVSSGQSLVYSSSMDPEAATAMLQTAEDQLRELHISGKEAKAAVIQVHNLGIMVNGNNQGVRITLTVMPEGQVPYSAEAVGIIGERSWPYYQAGQVITVKVDPDDKTRVSFWKSSNDPA